MSSPPLERFDHHVRITILSRDSRRLFVTPLARLFAGGFLAVLRVRYLTQAGLREASIERLLTFTLIADMVISLTCDAP